MRSLVTLGLVALLGACGGGASDTAPPVAGGVTKPPVSDRTNVSPVAAGASGVDTAPPLATGNSPPTTAATPPPEGTKAVTPTSGMPDTGGAPVKPHPVTGTPPPANKPPTPVPAPKP